MLIQILPKSVKQLRWNKIIPWLILGVIFLILFRVYLLPGIPDSHDGQIHLARFGNFKRAFREGQFPPRWGPNLLNGYGYPVFNFNYPLANLIALPLSFLPISYELIFKLIVVGSFLLTLIQLNRFLKIIGIDKPLARVAALSAFLLNPYMINLIYYRGGIGEILAIGLIVWLLVVFEKIRNGQFRLNSPLRQLELGTLVSLFVLSHNVLAYFGVLVLAAYLIWTRMSFRWYLRMVKPALIAFGWSAWFWIPALVEKKFTVLDDSSISNMFQDQFPTLSQLLLAPIQFGYSHEAPVDGLSQSIGVITILAIILSISHWLVSNLSSSHKHAAKSTHFTVWLGLILILVLLQLPFSLPVWQVVPMGKFIQFPWRLSAFIAIFSVPLVGLLMKKLDKMGRLAVWLVIIWQALALWRVDQPGMVVKSNFYHETFPESTSTMHENKAQTFELYKYDEWEPRPTIHGDGLAEVIFWNGTRRSYHLQIKEKALIIEQTMKFPGWQTRANNTPVEYVDSELIKGRIAYILPAGSYLIETSFTQNTPARKVGNTLFVVTFIYACYQLLKRQYDKSISRS